MAAPDTSPRRSHTAVVLTAIIVLVLGGGFIVLRRFVHREVERGAKTIEARHQLEQLGLKATQAYERDKKVCPSASRLVPSARRGSDVKADVKAVSDRRAWERDAERHAGFACLGFSIDAHDYRYEYVATDDGFTARAYGGDAERGIFEIRGRVVAGRLALGAVREIAPSTPEPSSQED